MDKQHFDQLVKGVREVKRHIAGKRVRVAKVAVTQIDVASVKSIREAAQVSQSQMPN